MVKVLILVRMTNCYRNIKWIEDILITKNSDFQQLAGKSTNKWFILMIKLLFIDATETQSNT
ncbi:hypothetical protein [Spiroplasma poulsonii]|uniref:hypothetical protein n=1 Tax=Spiroplasma poulsonii TaxID=2138 RepID=UPI001F4CDAF7|nr:hypothetical protein [Spiroplasma poulsonii]UNF61684.1 hypothetical protein MNU24_07170 [Spiroplasma poulsonii]